MFSVGSGDVSGDSELIADSAAMARLAMFCWCQLLNLGDRSTHGSDFETLIVRVEGHDAVVLCVAIKAAVVASRGLERRESEFIPSWLRGCWAAWGQGRRWLRHTCKDFPRIVLCGRRRQIMAGGSRHSPTVISYRHRGRVWPSGGKRSRPVTAHGAKAY